MASSNSRTVSLKFTGDIADLVAAVGGADAALRGVNKTAGDTSSLDKLNAVSGTTAKVMGITLAAGAVGGAAALAGVGVAAIGAAALLLKSNQQVDNAAHDLTDTFKTQAQESAAALQGPLVGALGQLKTTAQAARPELDEVFTGIAPDIPIVTTGLQGMVNDLLPGLANAARNSQPVMQGTANVLVDLGETGGDALTTLSNNAGNFGAVMTSVGSITKTAGATIANVASDAGTVWGQNADGIDSAVEGIGRAISGVASGAVPVLSEGLTIITNDITLATSALSPFTGLLGGVAASAAVAFGGFKLAGAVTSGVNSLAGGLGSLAKKVTPASASMGGLLKTASSTASTMAGPLGAAVSVVALGLGIYAQYANKGVIGQQELTDSANQLAQALNATGGAASTASVNALHNTQAWKDLVPQLQAAGISQQQATTAITQGGPALAALNSKLSDSATANTRLNVETKGTNSSLSAQAQQATATKTNLDNLNVTYQQAVQAAKDQAQAAEDAANAQQQANIQLLNTTGINFAGPMSTINSSLATLGSKTADDATKVNALATALDALLNPGGAAISTLAGIVTAEQGLGDQLKGLKGPITDANGDILLNSTRGAAAATAIESLSSNYNSYIAQAKQAGVPMSQINANLQTQYDNLLQTVTGFAGSKSAAAAYLKQIGILPPSTQTTADFNDLNAIAAVTSYGGVVKSAPTSTTVVATALTQNAINQLTNLGYTVTHLPNGQFLVSTNTAPAQAALNSFINTNSGRTVYLNTQFAGAGNPTNQRRATGGPVSAARSYLVGENGPEIFTPSSGGSITNNGQTDRILSGAGAEGYGATINLNLDLGEGIQQRVQVQLDRNNRVLKQRVLAGSR